METESYKISGLSTIKYEIFLDLEDGLEVKYGEISKKVSLDNLSKVKISPANSIGAVFVELFIEENGKEKKFFKISSTAINPDLKFFLNDLKKLVKDGILWENLVETEDNYLDLKKRRVYDLNMFRFMPGKPRFFQLYVFCGILCVTLIFLPIFVYLVASGAYRLKTEGEGISIRKFGSSKYKWSEISNIEYSGKRSDSLVRAGVGASNYFSFTVFLENGRSEKFDLRTLEGGKLLKELVARKILDKENLESIIF